MNNYYYKYLKYKFKLIKLKQIGGMEKKLEKFKFDSDEELDGLEFNDSEEVLELFELSKLPPLSEIRAFPKLDKKLLNYIKYQLKYLSPYNTLPLGIGNTEENIIITMYKTISSGGAFTNKISKNGKFYDSINISELRINTNSFMDLAKKLLLNYEKKDDLKNDTYVKVYRMIKLTEINEEDIIQPIPFSCSWDIEFPIYKWGGIDDCCIFELIMRMDTLFLVTSNPDPNFLCIKDNEELLKAYWKTDENVLINNQEQLEVILPPCILQYIDKRINPFPKYNEHTKKYENKDITIYSYFVNKLNDFGGTFNLYQKRGYDKMDKL